MDFPALYLAGRGAGERLIREQDLTELLSARKLRHGAAKFFLYHGARKFPHLFRPCGRFLVDEQKDRLPVPLKNCEIAPGKSGHNTRLVLGKKDLGAVGEYQDLLFPADNMEPAVFIPFPDIAGEEEISFQDCRAGQISSAKGSKEGLPGTLIATPELVSVSP